MMKCLLTVLFSIALLTDLDAQVSNEFNGKVSDETSNPVPGVVARLLNTNFTAVSDSAGNFKFIAVPQGNFELVLSKNGFAIAQASINIPSDQTITYTLKPSARELDAVIVTGQ